MLNKSSTPAKRYHLPRGCKESFPGGAAIVELLEKYLVLWGESGTGSTGTGAGTGIGTGAAFGTNDEDDDLYS